MKEEKDSLQVDIDEIEEKSDTSDYFTEEDIKNLIDERNQKKKLAFKNHRDSLICRAQSSIKEFEYFCEIMKIPNFVSAETIAQGNATISTGCAEYFRMGQTRQVREIYELFGIAHANTRLTSGALDNNDFSRCEIHLNGPLGKLQNGIHKFINHTLETKEANYVQVSPYHAAFTTEVIRGYLPR